MSQGCTLKLTVRDVRGRPLREQVKIRLENHETARRVEGTASGESDLVRVQGLEGAPGNLYKLTVLTDSYRAAQRFVTLRGRTSELAVTLPVKASKVKAVRFPDFRELAEDTQRALGSRERYERLHDEQRAGLLNIMAKCGRTQFGDGSTVRSFIEGLEEVRRDRVFAAVNRRLFEAVSNSLEDRLFHQVNGSLHSRRGLRRVASFKTPDAYGNLQLTFFRQEIDWVADIDIDDAAGLEHVFQVVRNAVTRKPTHPYDIHQILLGHQELDPGYDLLVHRAA